MWLRIIQHLLPRARAWSLTVDKTLRQYFDGLVTAIAEPLITKLDGLFLDLFPATSTQLDEYEDQFGLSYLPVYDEDARRERLVGEWQAVGGQDAAYIQGLLQAAGFDLYVYDWFEASGTTGDAIAFGETGTAFGEGEVVFGGAPAVTGYQARNPYTLLAAYGVPAVAARSGVPQCGGFDRAMCGSLTVVGGSLLVNKPTQKVYPIPSSTKWPYIIYVGGENLTEAIVTAERRAELERLLLKVRPLHYWIGLITQYVPRSLQDVYAFDETLSAGTAYAHGVASLQNIGENGGYNRREAITKGNLFDAFPSGKFYIEIAAKNIEQMDGGAVGAGAFYGGGSGSPNGYTLMGLGTPSGLASSTNNTAIVDTTGAIDNPEVAAARLSAYVWGVEAFGVKQRFQRHNTTDQSSSTNYDGSQLYFYEESVIMIAVDFSDAMAATTLDSGTVKHWLGRNGSWFGAGGPDTNPAGLHSHTYDGIIGNDNPFVEFGLEALALHIFFSMDGFVGEQHRCDCTIYGTSNNPFNYTVPDSFNT